MADTPTSSPPSASGAKGTHYHSAKEFIERNFPEYAASNPCDRCGQPESAHSGIERFCPFYSTFRAMQGAAPVVPSTASTEPSEDFLNSTGCDSPPAGKSSQEFTSSGQLAAPPDARAPEGTEPSEPDKHERGLFEKFRVERTDGTSAPGQKHNGCEYFVLDLTHDPFAIPALLVYATACAAEYPALARDLRRLARAAELRHIPPEYFGEQKR